WTTALELPGVAPRGGVYFAGAHAHPGGTLEAIGMATAAIAEAVGPSAR
ncbi:MAG: UDP-galactopyranose mutase, partial [Flavobacterium sp.]|nr:UDP-galactopyranose mutase [Aeromicrobium sp.]